MNNEIHAGKEALASVGGSAAVILNFLFSFFMGLSAGATVIIAQYYGAGHKEKVDITLHTTYAFGLIGGIFLGLIGVMGVAIATDISQLLSAIAVTVILLGHAEGMQLSFRKLRIDFPTLGRILRIGFPTAIAGSMFSVSNMIVQTSIVR